MRHPSHHPEYRRRGRAWIHAGIALAGLALFGCRTHHEIDVKPTQHTVKIEPIYMTVDINLRVQRELDRFYSDVVGGTNAQPVEGGEL